jgi:glycosyltransferase involved in cell wall biosynthesis
MQASGSLPLVFYTKQNIAKRLPPPFNLIRRRCYRRAAAAWAVGATTRDVLQATGFTGRSAIVPHGVDVGRFSPGPGTALRARLGLSRIVVGFVGRLVPEKGIGDLLSALRGMDPRLDVTLLVVGSGPLVSDVQRTAGTAPLAGRVAVLPAVPHDGMPEVYRAMDILVVPSRTTSAWREQFGRVLVEAAASGIPVIASDSGEIPLVVRDLQNGLLVPEQDITALSGAIAALAGDAGRRRALAAAGLAAVRRSYSQEAIAERMATLLRDLGRH